MKPFRCLLIVAALCLAGTLTSTHAQATPRPNAIVNRYDDASKTVQFWAYSPGNPQAHKLFDLPQGLYAEFSADGQFYTAFGQDPATNQPKSFFGRVGQPNTTPIPVEKDYAFVSGKFSPDGHYLAYALAQQPTDTSGQAVQLKWMLGLLDLTNNTVTRFSGVIVYPTDANGKPNAKPASGFFFAPMPTAWSADSSHLFILTYAPFSDGGPGDIYAIDVNSVKGKTGDQPLPAVQGIPREGIPAFALTQISPDATKLAYVYGDPARPVPNYQGMFDAANTIRIVDLMSGKTLATAMSPKDQGIGFNVSWTADSKTFLYSAGAFKTDPASGMSLMVAPRLYTVDVTGKVSDGLAFVGEQEGEIQSLLACSDSLFFSIVKNSATGSTFTLYSAPLTDLTKRSAPLLSSTAYLQLSGCTPS